MQFRCYKVAWPLGGLAKMAAGEPQTDEDRWPFLDAVAEALRIANTPSVS